MQNTVHSESLSSLCCVEYDFCECLFCFIFFLWFSLISVNSFPMMFFPGQLLFFTSKDCSFVSPVDQYISPGTPSARTLSAFMSSSQNSLQLFISSDRISDTLFPVCPVWVVWQGFGFYLCLKCRVCLICVHLLILKHTGNSSKETGKSRSVVLTFLLL